MRALFKRLLKITCLMGLFYSAYNFCESQTDGFTIARIRSEFAPSSKWQNPLLTPLEKEQLSAILDQEFVYLARGGQCFAFESTDGKFVIKLFKNYLSPLQNWLLSLPLPAHFKKSQQKKIDRTEKKRDRDFTSYQLVFQELKEESGLVYLHLNPTQGDYKPLTIRDKLGIAHRISLDNASFIIQKKGELVYPHLKHLMDEGKIEEAKQAIGSLLNVILARSKKGIFDEDAKIHRNFGFIGNQALFIDVGRFRKDPSMTDPTVCKNDLQKTMRRFHAWLQESYPQLAEYLDDKTEEKDV